VLTLVGSNGLVSRIGIESVATVYIEPSHTAVVVATTPQAYTAGPVDGVFTVELTSPPSADTTVTYALTGSATSADYTASAASTVSFSVGQTAATVHITPAASVVGLPDVVLTLTSVSGVTFLVGTPSVATVHINHQASVSGPHAMARSCLCLSGALTFR
jgi:hypothetical protein